MVLNGFHVQQKKLSTKTHLKYYRYFKDIMVAYYYSKCPTNMILFYYFSVKTRLYRSSLDKYILYNIDCLKFKWKF